MNIKRSPRTSPGQEGGDDMTAIKAIETKYAGYRFRSRQEARWAVFLDHLKVPWLYEPQGYDLGGAGAYLPDFLIYPDTDRAFWFEVKGAFPTDAELRKAQVLSTGSGIPIFVYYGPVDVPASPELENLQFTKYMDKGASWVWDNKAGWLEAQIGPAPWEVGLVPTAFRLNPRQHELKSGHWWWTDCDQCGAVVLKLHGQVGWCPTFNHNEAALESRPLYPSFAHATPRLTAAYAAAKAARFEHGECG